MLRVPRPLEIAIEDAGRAAFGYCAEHNLPHDSAEITGFMKGYLAAAGEFNVFGSDDLVIEELLKKAFQKAVAEN
jgi:hypothetical protein